MPVSLDIFMINKLKSIKKIIALDKKAKMDSNVNLKNDRWILLQNAFLWLCVNIICKTILE